MIRAPCSLQSYPMAPAIHEEHLMFRPLTPAHYRVIIHHMINPPKYAKPAYVKVPTKTQLRKELAQLKHDIKAGLNGPDRELYVMMDKALKGLDIR